jgi:hypothetical protein
MEKKLKDGELEMAHGIEAIRKWQTAEDLIVIKNNDGTIDEIPIRRVPNSEFPKLMKLGVKFQSTPKDVTEADFNMFIELMVTSIASANAGVDRVEVKNFVITKFQDVAKSFMEVNGGNLEVNEIPQDIRDALGMEDKGEDKKQ